MNQPVDLSKIKSVKDLKSAGKKLGLQKGEKTKSRKLGLDISKKIDKNLEKVQGEETLDKYFEIITNLLSKYKKSPVILDKLHLLIDNLATKDANVAKAQMEVIVSVFSDPRFKESSKKKLIDFLLKDESDIDLDSFYLQTQKAYSIYENSFTEGELSPFVVFRTSPRLKVELSKDFEYNNMIISAEKFNSVELSDIDKVLYIIESMSKAKFRVNPNDFISYVVGSLSFRINFNFSPDNVKADLKLKEPLIIDVGKFIPQTLAEKGKNVEIKMKPYNVDDYLSEFFKIDSTEKNASKILNAISQIPNIAEPNKGMQIFMESISNNLLMSIKKQNGDKIIDHLTKDIAGIIFKNDIFIKGEDIKYYWTSKGYAGRSRLSMWYHVDNNAKKYKISKTAEGYTRFLLEV